MFLSYDDFLRSLKRIQAEIAAAEEEAGRTAGSVKLLPVTKNHPVEAAAYAFRAGLRSVGENRVQEALSKMDEAAPDLRWELIGPLQRNKAKKAAERFYRIQSVDRPQLVEALQRHASESGLSLRVLLQINAGEDPNKSGASLEAAPALLEAALKQENLIVDGLMTIAPLDENLRVAQACFASLRQCRDRLESDFGVSLPELSMGMSGDMREAIIEGSTMVRVGTALYGKRDYA